MMIDTFLRTIGMTIGTFLIPMARPADPVKHVSTRRRLTIEFGPSLELISTLLKQKKLLSSWTQTEWGSDPVRCCSSHSTKVAANISPFQQI